MSKLWLVQEISNHPRFPNIRRSINVREANLQAFYEQVIVDAYISYFDENDVDVTSAFKSELAAWGCLNNSVTTTVMDEDGNTVPNPEYMSPEETPNVSQYLKQPSFDYFYDLVTIHRVDLISLLQAHILFDDALGEFNF